MKKIWNFIKETWQCYTSANSLMYNGTENIKASTLTAIFVEYFCAGYMFTIFVILIFTLTLTMVQTGFNLSLFICLFCLIGFIITTISTIKNKWCQYYNQVVNGFESILKELGIKKDKMEVVVNE